MKNIISIVLLLVLAACGGGGGGGDGGGQSGTKAGLLSVTFSTSTLNFEYVEGEEPRSQSMSASASGNSDQNILIGAEVSGTGLALPISVVVNLASRTASITVTPARGLKAGTYGGTIKMSACTTQNCQQHHNGSPYEVTYKVTVRPPEAPVLATMGYSNTSLSFTMDEGQDPVSQTVTAQANGNTNRAVSMRAELSGEALALPLRMAVDSTSKKATITATPAYGLKAGVYTGNVKLTACANSDCSLQHLASPYTLPYTVTVYPRLKADPVSLDLAAPESGSSVATPVSLVLPGPGAAVNATVSYVAGASGWLTAQINGAKLTVQASAKTLLAGTYQAKLTLSVPAKSQFVEIPVSLTVASGLSVPERATLSIDSGTTAQEMQGTIALAMAPGATASTWTASSNQSWLQLVSASGGIATLPAWRIDPAAFALLANGQRYTAVVTVKTDAALPPKTWTLDMQKNLAEISGLDTVALLAGQGGDVLLYGRGFDKLPPAAVVVAGAQPTAVKLLSARVLRLTMPVLQAGSYEVTLRSASGAAMRGKSIKVTTRDTYGYQALGTQGEKRMVVWDAVSKSAFVLNRTLKSVMRYAAVNGRFQLAATRSLEFVDSIAMAPDRSALILRSGATKIYKLSPADLSIISMFNLGTGSGYQNDLPGPLPITGDNRLMQGGFWVDLDTGASTQAEFSRYTEIYGQADWLAVSGNGMRALWPASGYYTPRNPIMWIDLIGGKYTPFGMPADNATYFYDFSVNHDGSKWQFNNKVVDFDMTLLGSVVLPAGAFSRVSVFSRDGSRLYFYVYHHEDPQMKPRVYVYDTSAALTTAINFPLLGYIEFDDLPNCPYSYNWDQERCFPFSTTMAITDDDQTLLVAGDTKFVVLPIPAAMRAPVTATVRQVLGGQTVIPVRP
ncbi:COG1470 family protein [Pseudoduganella aquatica]|uniref:COG1470 family protein n=1 Tax=Pseudoduganella aquatica TaxID=2660641 RepID=UPI001E38918D|nr:hypothetical protein [Pseudoduganella aquatica]